MNPKTDPYGFNLNEIYACADCEGKYTGASIAEHLIEEFKKKKQGDTVHFQLFPERL